MEIFVPKFNIDIKGIVHLSIKDGDGAIKQDEKFNNSIHDDLKNAILNHMGASSGSSSHHITTASNWFSSTHSEQDGKDGIFIWQSNNASQVQTYVAPVSNGTGYDLKLDESTSMAGSGNAYSWTCEGTWTGQSGTGTVSSASFDKMHIGKGFSLSASDIPSFSTTFATAQSSGDFTAFSLDDNDVARVTWTITIG